MENLQLVNLIITFIGGGVVTAIFNFIVHRSKEKRDDFESILNAFREENTRLRVTENELKNKLNSLEEIVFGLKVKLIQLESAHLNMPIPKWIKDKDGTIITVNKAYEDMFLIPQGYTALDYIGKKDTDIWSEEIANDYMNNDVKALDRIVYAREKIILNKRTFYVLVIKYPREVDGVTIGTAGIAVPDYYIEHLFKS